MSCPHGNPISGCDTCDEVDAAFEAGKRSALAEQPAQQQEPVAWMHWLHGPVRLFFNKDEAQMELERLNREYPVDVGSRKMRPLVFGDTSPPTLSLAQVCLDLHDALGCKWGDNVYLAIKQLKEQTAQQPRKPLTDEQIKGIYEDCDAPTGGQFTLAFTRAIEAAHGIKGDA